MQISIIDYGLGNLHSVLGAIHKLEYDAKVTNDISTILSSDKIILPGVGAFEDGMKNLINLNLIDVLEDFVNIKKRPILGICLGFQLLAKESYEFGQHKGLGWIDASIKKLYSKNIKIRVPHVGWNNLFKCKESKLFDGIPNSSLFYYVHSYFMNCENEKIIIGKCKYGLEFVSAIQQQNIFGTQFHPEKSQLYGLQILKNFLEKT